MLYGLFGAYGPKGPRAPSTVPSGICGPSLCIAVSPVVRIVRLCFMRPRGPACRMSASRSPSQKLEWITSAPEPSNAEISALYWPAKSFGICEVFTSIVGTSAFIASSKSPQESWPQA